jgi:tripeptidyl-peptidase I
MLSKGLLYGSLLSLAAPALGGIQSKLAAVPKGWSAASQTSDHTSITLSIGLTRQNVDQLESKLLAVSTPGSPSYGKYLDNAAVNALFAPSTVAVSSVVSWLKSHGVKNINVDGAWIDFATTVGTANTLLGASYKYYQSEGVTKLRTLQYEIPDELEAHIDLVEPSTYFGKTQAFRAIRTPFLEEAPEAKRAIDPSCEKYITPSCLRAVSYFVFHGLSMNLIRSRCTTSVITLPTQSPAAVLALEAS